MKVINTNKTIKAMDIEKEFKIHRDTAQEDLNKLIKLNKIIKKGAGSNVWYELKEIN